MVWYGCHARAVIEMCLPNAEALSSEEKDAHMTHQITLTEDEYAVLAAAAARTGASIEELVHQVILDQFPLPQQIGSYQYPTGEPITAEEEDELERLAQEIGPDKPWASEIVIEDRGPR